MFFGGGQRRRGGQQQQQQRQGGDAPVNPMAGLMQVRATVCWWVLGVVLLMDDVLGVVLLMGVSVCDSVLMSAWCAGGCLVC